MPADYYFVLGISRGADLKKIKNAYRKVAKQYHPDITHSSECAHRFLQIKEAYETLADEEKRKAYDDELARQETSPPITGIPGMIKRPVTGFDEVDRFSGVVDEFFEGFLPGFFERGKHRFPPKDLYYEIILSPTEALRGGLFPITIPVIEICSRCSESGYGHSFFCPICRGYGRIRSERTLSLSIPPHTTHGAQVRLSLEDIGLKDAFLNILVTVDPAIADEMW